MTDDRQAQLDALSTEELRKRAFHAAEHRHDLGFFWDLVKHLPAAGAVATDDSFSATGMSLSDLLELFREFRGEHLGAAEPMLRAKFVTYLLEHGD